MSDRYQPTILFVDDEVPVLNALRRLFRKYPYHIETANSGPEGLEFLSKAEKNRVALIVSDQRMPVMNGAAFLKQTRDISPDSIRFLLTGYSDLDAVISSVNQGGIHRYLTKPWNDDDLVFQVAQGIEQFELKNENKRLLAVTEKQKKQLYDFAKNMEQKVKVYSKEIIEKNKRLEFLNKELELSLYNTVRAFAAISDMHMPASKGHGKRVSDFCKAIAQQLGLTPQTITALEIAAMLHDIGKIGFPQKLISYSDETKLTQEEKAKLMAHPIEGERLALFVHRLEDVGRFIRHHHERYDGQGYPDSLTEEDIPIGARIIAVADAYDRALNIETVQKKCLEMYVHEKNISLSRIPKTKLIEEAAANYIKHNSFSWFDPEIVKAFLDILKGQGVRNRQELKISFYDITEGMTLTRDVYSNSGRYLLPGDTVITRNLISKLRRIDANEGIAGDIHILKMI